MLVLVVEDDAVTRTVVLGRLARAPDVRAIGAGTIAEARSMLAQASPDLVLLDLELPDGAGLDLFPDLDDHPRRPNVIVLSAHVQGRHDALGERVERLGKPIDFDVLVQRVARHGRATGTPTPFGPIDYVQVACIGRHSVRITCASAEVNGEILVNRGELWSASDGSTSGTIALQRLLRAPGLRLMAEKLGPDPGPRNLDAHREGTGLDAMLRDSSREGGSGGPADETQAAARPPDTNTPSEPVAPAFALGAADADELVGEAARAIVAADFEGALGLLEQAQRLRPHDAAIEHRIRRVRMASKEGGHG